MHYSKEFTNGSSCLGLNLNMDNSMGTPSFEFPSVWVDVENYQSQLIKGDGQQIWISPDDCPENKLHNLKESKQMEEFYPLDRITLSAPSVPEEELCVEPEMVETIAIEREMDEILMKLAESFSLLNGEENLWFLVGDDVYEGLEGEFEKLKRDILEFNPFGQ
ncbi:hypothetical protein PNOK_0016800 [Pyrrhoderma noxium]|uniref:Uncharacterized protein n=1 Tax=Pyrrhoderma noxium TaxID=2282107 RepID=A0A286UU40_9AGAM|nr:hypothetical protein PNOK_0016800 [Pyrrhoderma noxium]